MTGSTFSSDLERLLADLASARSELISAAQGLTQEELHRPAQSDEWSPRTILEHVARSERVYAMMVIQLCGKGVSQPGGPPFAGDCLGALLSHLETSRSELLSALDGVSEHDLYREQALGPRNWSVLGIAQHSADHDREHAAQIREILGAAAS